MKPNLLLAVAVSGVTLIAASAFAPSAFDRFVDDYFRAQFEFSPSLASSQGFHEYDGKLEDLSAASVNRRIADLKVLQDRLAKLESGHLQEADSIDATLLGNAIRAELLDLETIGEWRRNPMNYIYLSGGAVDGLMKRDFAPAADRLRSVTARLKGIPPLLAAMRSNVENPPREFTDLALRMARGSVSFFRDTVSAWGRTAAGPNAELLKEFEEANRAATDAIGGAAGWLEKDLLPRSKGTYAIGPDLFRKKLLYEEMADIPLDRLLEIGKANLRKDYDAFVATAKKIDPDRTPLEVMKSVSAEHPCEATLLRFAEETIEKTRRFLIEKDIVTIPSAVRPLIRETPPYARSGGFASMDTPGPFEMKATEAFYYVTPTEKDWTPKQKEEHLRLFNRATMDVITIHEAYPGHYLQFLYAKQFPTKTRKLVISGTNAEGWAHYTEQMAMEEGFGNGDPKIRLAQLSEALLRDCRYVVGIQLHTAGMTVAEGAKVFETHGFAEPQVAFEEARRGTYNPTYLYYTLGKLQIYKLREDYRRARGEAFRLREFHDRFVSQGGMPIPLLRRILLPGDTSPAL